MDSNNSDELKAAARRSSDMMSAFASKRHGRVGSSVSDDAANPAAEVPERSNVRRRDERSGSRSEKPVVAGLGKHSAVDAVSDDARRGRHAHRSEKRDRGDKTGEHHRRSGQGERGGRAQSKRTQREAGYPKTLGAYVRQNSAFILSAVAVVAVVIVLIAFVRIMMPFSGSDDPNADSATASGSHGASQTESDSTSGLDWANLRFADGRFSYVVDGQVKSRTGIDVSDHQRVYDWDAVAADGIDFVIVRIGYRGATEGKIHLDEHFEANLAGAQAAGLDCGVYFFSQAVTADEAREEADFIVKHLDGQKLAYPVVFDSEVGVEGIENVRTASLTSDELVSVAEAFCERIEEAGYEFMLYGNVADLVRYTNEYREKQAVWWAEYGPETPSYTDKMAMWQYASDGAVAGVEDGTDMSIDLREAQN